MTAVVYKELQVYTGLAVALADSVELDSGIVDKRKELRVDTGLDVVMVADSAEEQIAMGVEHEIGG